MEEIRKDTHKQYYKISNLGRIWIQEHKLKGNCGYRIAKEKIYKGTMHQGYLGCYIGGIHVLMARAFIPNPNNYPQVRHLNDIKTDNRLENLARGTDSDNKYDAFKNGKRIAPFKGKFGKEHNKSKRTGQYDLEGNLIKERGSTKEIERELGIGNIPHVCSGKYKTAGGFIWKYL